MAVALLLIFIYTSVCMFVGWELHGMWMEKSKKDAKQ